MCAHRHTDTRTLEPRLILVTVSPLFWNDALVIKSVRSAPAGIRARLWGLQISADSLQDGLGASEGHTHIARVPGLCLLDERQGSLRAAPPRGADPGPGAPAVRGAEPCKGKQLEHTRNTGTRAKEDGGAGVTGDFTVETG